MENTATSDSLPTTSLYAAAIAIVSGVYSVLAASGGMGTMAGTGWTGSAGAWIMLLVGFVALVHGIVLLTPAASRLGRWSGPLMIGYAAVMLLNRAFLPMGAGFTGGPGQMGRGGPGMMDGGGFGGMMGDYLGTMGPAGGTGMVALAILMLVSGVIMTVRADQMMRM